MAAAAHPVERLADPVENHKTDNGEQYGGSGRNIFRADRKFLAEDDECCDHQKVGQRRRQGPCQNVRDKVARDPVFVRHQREQEAWNTDRKHTDQRDLGLIPSFCGTGYYGLKVHEGVLSRGVKVTGATVHFVDGGTDTGPIILQKAVEVHEGDTPKALQQRVMEEAEWVIMPRAIDLIANGKVTVEDGHVKIKE